MQRYQIQRRWTPPCHCWCGMPSASEYFILVYSPGLCRLYNKERRAGLEKFNRAVDYSDLLISKDYLPLHDTNVLILATLVAENAKNPDAAAKVLHPPLRCRLSGKIMKVSSFPRKLLFPAKGWPPLINTKVLAWVYPKSRIFHLWKWILLSGLRKGLMIN